MPAKRLTALSLVLGAWLGGAAPAPADDLAGAERLLCATLEVTACIPGGTCAPLSPDELNVPRFLEIDLAGRLLATTEASGENRRTPIEHLRRDGGLVFVQGVEQGRAFSLLIVEATGELTASVAREALGVVVFGACTPMPAGAPRQGEPR